ncbi:MAG: hypothetical protein DHS20C02_15340 [Micavibrio sp.]|nr:MAG: hypothetical protein DHS20C02_15340 [Micavibrio sp.]
MDDWEVELLIRHHTERGENKSGQSIFGTYFRQVSHNQFAEHGRTITQHGIDPELKGLIP